ncbi:MAG: alpha/beta hydrolase [Pseudomonadota bacterium]
MIRGMLLGICLTIAAALIAIYAISWTKQARVAQAFPPIGQFIELDGGRLHYIDKGDGPALILLHGAGANLRDWTFRQFDTLAKTHRVIAFDRPGYGYSDRFAHGHLTLEREAMLIKQAAEKLGVSNAMIVGFSYGGTVTARLALDHPDFAQKLLLIAPAVHDWPSRTVDWTHGLLSTPVIGPLAMNIVYALAPRSYFMNAYRGVFYPEDLPEGYLDHVGLGLSTKPSVQVHNGHQIQNLLSEIEKMMPRYAELTQRIHLIHGTADRSVSYQYHSEDFIADAVNADITFEFIDGIGHGIHQSGTDQILSAIEMLSQD